MADAKPRCRLYLELPAPLTAKVEAQLMQIMGNTSAACVLLGDDGGRSDENHAGRLVDLVQAAGLACLVADDVALAERLGADGVHIDADETLFKQARDRLGESASIGVGCGRSRHEAMRFAEMGADYIALMRDEAATIDTVDQDSELIAWWSEIFVVPCVAWNVETPDEAARFARLGADFVAPAKQLWRDDRATSLIAEIDSTISRARRAA